MQELLIPCLWMVMEFLMYHLIVKQSSRFASILYNGCSVYDYTIVEVIIAWLMSAFVLA
jgi:hypothetical protein